MRKKSTYEEVKLKIVLLECRDIVTSSDNDTMGTGGNNKTDDGWTPIEW